MDHKGARPGRSLQVLVGCLCLAVGLLVALPTVAMADYSIDQVDIDATVASDGSVAVTETREFDFDDDYNGVYWKIPTGQTADGRTIETSIDAVGMEEDGKFVPFDQVDQGYNGMDGVYEVSDEGSVISVKLYHPVDDESARYVIKYTDANLAERFSDTSELYWKFVSDGWDVESNNVTCTVHLPIPAGATVLHDGSADANLRAWGHGPLDASVSFDDDNDVVYDVPGVGTEEFAEARIAFPADWLSEATPQNENKLQDILAEEQQWADEANAKRQRARIVTGVASAVGFGGTLLTVVMCIVLKIGYKRDHKPQFDDKYFRDVPSDDHPAVLGALLNDGKTTEECFSASLMRLTDLGAMGLDLVKYKGKKGLMGQKDEQDYRLTRKIQKIGDDGRQRPKGADIDDKTLHFVFDRVGTLSGKDHGGRDSEGLPTDANTVYFSEFERAAKLHPESYNSAWESWQHAVEGACESRNFFVEMKGKDYRGKATKFGSLNVVLAIVMFALLWFDIVPLFIGGATFVLAIVCTIVCFLIAGSMTPLSAEAVELTAKLKALKRWLKDFTRLEEAWPRDVILWNKLLVMAVVLGVADEVIDQLKVAAPEILDDPYMRPVYGWYYLGGPYGYGRPMDNLNSATQAAHKVTNAALSSSSSSSGGGGGGGFSGGGGGGFGGGGGGGAF